MSSATVRIKPATLVTLRTLAAKSGRPMSEELEQAVEQRKRQQFLEQLNADFAALRADPEAWAEELEERRLFEGTLMDDLEDDPEEALA